MGLYQPRGCETFYFCHTLLTRRDIRVYRVSPRPPREPVHYDMTRALWLPTHRITSLGDKWDEGFWEPGLTRIAASGEFVAYALTGTAVFRQENSEGLGWQLWRLNVRTGRREQVRREHKCVAADLSEEWNAPGVSDLLITPRGTMAWIFGSFSQYPPNYRVCEMPEGSTHPVLLASSQTIAPKSLRIASNRLSWTENATPRSAPLTTGPRPSRRR